jgi:sugar/nucleoside kinase (ribokinase family)
MAQDVHAVVAGHICLDMIPALGHVPEGAFAELFRPGHLINVGPVLFSTGGPVSNTGLALIRLGVPTRLIAKVGADPFAGIVRALVAGFDPGLVQGLVTDEAAPTSYTVIINPPGVDRIFLHCPGANDHFSARDVDLDLVARARLFHFGYPPIMRRMYLAGGAELAEIFRLAKATGVTTSLDMSFPDPASESGQADWRAILRATLPAVDLFLPSFEEILFMLRRETFDQAPGGRLMELLSPALLAGLSDELLEMGARMVLIKLGSQGAYLRTAGPDRLRGMGRAAPGDPDAWANQALWAPCFRVGVVGTTGSGDATIAGFLSALLRGFPSRQSLTAAVAVGACNVEAADALGGLRTWEDTLARIQAGWQRLPVMLSAPGWAWDAADQVWVGPGGRSGQGG